MCPARPRTHLHDQLGTREVAASGPVKPLPVAPPLMLRSREREQVARTASERRAGNSVPAPALRLMLHGVFSAPRTRYALNPRENLARVTTVTSFLQTGTLRHRRLHTRPARAQPRSAADHRLTTKSHGSGSSAVRRANAGPTLRVPGSAAGPQSSASMRQRAEAGWLGCVGERKERGEQKVSYNITLCKKTKMSNRQVQLAGRQGRSLLVAQQAPWPRFISASPVQQGWGTARENCHLATGSQNTPGPAGRSATAETA